MTDLTGIGSLLDFGGKLIDRLWPDPAQRDAAKLELFRLQQSGELQTFMAENAVVLGQIQTNTTEAASNSLFVSGWRPAIGWICGLACGWNWIGLSVVGTVAKLSGSPVVLAAADVSEMMPVLIGMLGLGSLRTWERIKGVHRS